MSVTNRTAWRPQGFGRRRARTVEEPLIEPLWAGLRVLVHAEPGGSVQIVDAAGVELTAHFPDVAAAIPAALDATSAVLDGYLTSQATRTGAGTAVVVAEPPTASGMVGQMLLGRSGAGNTTPPTPVHDREELVAFVAVDLLEIDGDDLLDVPLLERKRILDSALVESDLVRRGLYVRPPVDSWMLSWRSIGFRRVAFKAQNGRYRPGSEAEDWAIADIPER